MIKIFAILLLVQTFVFGSYVDFVERSIFPTNLHNNNIVNNLKSSNEIAVSYNDIYDYWKNVENVLVRNTDSSLISKKADDSDCIKNVFKNLNDNCNEINELNERDRSKCECTM